MQPEWLDGNEEQKAPPETNSRGKISVISKLQKGRNQLIKIWERLGPPKDNPPSLPPKIPQDPQGLDAQEEIDFYELWWTIRKRLRAIIVFVVATVFVTGVTSFFILPKIYKAKATILPIESSEGGLLSMMGQLGSLAGVALPQKQTSSQTLIAVLESRSVAEGVIERLGLMKIFFSSDWDEKKNSWKDPDDPPKLEEGVRKLESIRTISSDRKTGLITIEAEYKDPQLAASIANAFVEELDRFINKNALSMAKRQRIFLEEQVEKTKGELQEAEEALKAFQEEKRLVVMDAQAQAAIKGLAELKAVITAKEVELDVLKTYATAQNPRVQILQSEIKELRKQLQKLEAEDSAKGGSDLSLASAPDLGLTYARLQRDVLYRSKVLELLYQQYEMAKINEAKEDVRFQVIDPAVPPFKKAKPKTLLNVALAFFLAGMIALMWAFIAEYVEKSRLRRQALVEAKDTPDEAPSSPLEGPQEKRPETLNGRRRKKLSRTATG